MTDPIIIKKYANRRLYDTSKSAYVTLDDLCQLIQNGQDFIVYDAKTGDDLTRSVLTQIIVEAESKGENLLPESFLKQVISFYGNQLQTFLPSYLEQMMQSFINNREKLEECMPKNITLFPFTSFEEINRQNIQLLEKTWQFFSTPHTTQHTPSSEPSTEDSSNTAKEDANKEDDKIMALEQQIKRLQESMRKLKKKTR